MGPQHTGQILVVESNAKLQSELEAELTAMGHIVDTAPGGAEALELVERSTPDVIVIGLESEGMDGFELLAWLRDRRPQLSVLVMTAYADDLTRSDTEALHGIRLLPKPIDVTMVEQLLEASTRGEPIEHITVAGRTTAWVPARQR